jgi:rhodanese-related sulfurtransferase
MKTLRLTNVKLLMLSILCVSMLMTSCKKDEPVNEAQVLVEYLESADSPLMKDYVSTDMPAIIAASEVKTLNETGQVYIMDIRAAADFATGYIENAVNVAAGDVLTHIEGVDLAPYTKVAIVCYSGQTAAWATCLLRIMGYSKVYSMKFGMCSWHEDFAGSWKNNIKNTYATQFTSDATAKGAEGDLPVLSTGFETGQEILEARVNAVLAEGFTPARIGAADVFGALSNFYIVNYWPENHYTDPGHIPGAMQYTPKQSMSISNTLKTLPADKTVVVYCYTGQTSANLAAYLRVLGYDAKSLLFGTNGMIYDVMAAKSMTTFKDADIMGYEYVQ